MSVRASPRHRWYVLLFLVSGVAGTIGLWVYSSADGGTRVASFGGLYSEASVGTPIRINPLFSGQNNVDDDLSALVFAGLTRVGSDGLVRPGLAESWEINSDATEYTFHLRDGLIWHDGHELTADDVVFTWTVLSSEDFPGDPELGAFWQTVTAERLDGLTVRFELDQPFAPFLVQTSIGIVPAHLLAGTPTSEMATAPFNQEPVGSGPYRLLDLNSREALLEANDAFHLGPPYIRRIQLNYYPTDAAALAALASGETDAFYTDEAVGRDQVDALRTDHSVSELINNSYTMLYLNWQVPILAEQPVRSAIALAIDREAIVQQILGGRGVLSEGVITPQSWAATDDLQTYAYDPERAASLLDEAGWELGPDGVRQRGPDSLSFELVTNTNSTRSAIASQIASDLQDVGISVRTSAAGGPALYEDVLQAHQFELALFGFSPGIDPDPFPAWHSSQADGGANISAFNDPESDEHLVEGRLSPALDRRAELYLRFQERFYDLLPGIVLYYPTSLYILPERLNGFEPGIAFSTASRFSNVWEWYIETEEVGT